MPELTEKEKDAVEKLEEAKQKLREEKEEVSKKCQKIKDKLASYQKKCDHENKHKKLGNIFVCEDCGIKVRQSQEGKDDG